MVCCRYKDEFLFPVAFAFVLPFLHLSGVVNCVHSACLVIPCPKRPPQWIHFFGVQSSPAGKDLQKLGAPIEAARQNTAQSKRRPGQAVLVCVITRQHKEAVKNAARVQTVWKQRDLKQG